MFAARLLASNEGDHQLGEGNVACAGVYYGPTDRETSVATIDRALERNVTLLDTADVYGAGHNEFLVGCDLSEIDAAQASGTHIVRAQAAASSSRRGRRLPDLVAATRSVHRADRS